MMFRSASAVLFLSSLITGCATTPIDLGQSPSTSRYCDRYFVYRMCAQDLSGDGEVDILYFQDTQKVFMYRPESTEPYAAQLAMHRCVQVMDEGLSKVSNKLLHIDSRTNFLKRTNIKSALLSHYLRYMPKIQRCKGKPADVTDADIEDDFGVFALEESEGSL